MFSTRLFFSSFALLALTAASHVDAEPSASASPVPTPIVSACLQGITTSYESVGTHISPGDLDIPGSFFKTAGVQIKYCLQVDGQASFTMGYKNAQGAISLSTFNTKINPDDSGSKDSTARFGDSASNSFFKWVTTFSAGKKKIREIWYESSKVVRDYSYDQNVTTLLSNRQILNSDVRKEVTINNSEGAYTATFTAKGSGKAFVVIKEIPKGWAEGADLQYVTVRYKVQPILFQESESKIPTGYAIDKESALTPQVEVKLKNSKVKVGTSFEIPAPLLSAKQKALVPNGYAWSVESIALGIMAL